MPKEETRGAAKSPRSLSGLLPFMRPYRGRIALALLFLVLAAMSTLAFPLALKSLIDQGLVSADPGARVLALRGHFLALFVVGAALGVFSAARFYMVSWLGERITADLRSAVYAHVVEQSPEFFESTQTGEVLSRLTTDTTLVQTVVGSSPEHGAAQHGDGPRRPGHPGGDQPLRDDAGARHPGAGGAAQPVLRPARAQPQPRQPGPRGRFQRHRRGSPERDSHRAELHAGKARIAALWRVHRTCLRGGRASARWCARTWWPSSSQPPSARCCAACTRARRR